VARVCLGCHACACQHRTCLHNPVSSGADMREIDRAVRVEAWFIWCMFQVAGSEGG
jgi:hypothetical protein